ncbi:MAG: 50S ribosomal protein L13 [Candidatus Micrarchaeota archaeon]|nr:50S ribosomal protein L13 [Candidatus Micrarchaeota archaeon]
MKIIDGTNLVLGRLGARISKYLLSGEQVVIINAEQVVIVGRTDMVVKRYWNRRQRKDKANPENSMHWSRRPDLFVKRCIRGMLPYKRATGRKAYKLLKAYMGEPAQFKNAAKEDMSDISCTNVKSRYIYIGKVCERLGYNKGV